MSNRQGANNGGDKRPVTGRWWWFFVVTAWAWLRLPLMAYDLRQGNALTSPDWAALAMLAVFLPTFIWLRRREARKRLVAE